MGLIWILFFLFLTISELWRACTIFPDRGSKEITTLNINDVSKKIYKRQIKKKLGKLNTK